MKIPYTKIVQGGDTHVLKCISHLVSGRRLMYLLSGPPEAARPYHSAHAHTVKRSTNVLASRRGAYLSAVRWPSRRSVASNGAAARESVRRMYNRRKVCRPARKSPDCTSPRMRGRCCSHAFSAHKGQIVMWQTAGWGEKTELNARGGVRVTQEIGPRKSDVDISARESACRACTALRLVVLVHQVNSEPGGGIGC